jgi:hypothetical protein
MTAIATIVLNDGAATPVAHTFTAAGVKNAIATWQDVSGGYSVGFPTATMASRPPTKTSKVTKVTGKVVLPITEILAPSTIPSKAFDLLGTVEFVLPENASVQNRKDLIAYMKNFLASTPFTDAVHNLAVTW